MLRILPRANVNSKFNIFILKPRQVVFSNCFPKHNEKRHGNDRAADLGKGRIDQGLAGNPCQRGCGDACVGAAGQRASAGPVPFLPLVPAQLWPFPQAEIEQRNFPTSCFKI